MRNEEPDDQSILLDILNNESPRGAVLAACGFLEQRLEDLLSTQIIDDKKIKSLLFSGANGPLGSLTTRIDFAYALGLIHKNTWQNLHKLRRIRNEFAHQYDASFDDNDIKDRTQSLDIPNTDVHLVDMYGQKRSARDTFVLSAILEITYLKFRILEIVRDKEK